ncbi:hypothetical protein FB565_006936 [Actinoplanes lutulentus]|uniref:ANTAR domain-containing protein n=1 Tax=Actinoplanes lutulentus TaxID=1287878 RepID=A0A327ZA47_9ACTN|nr:hypothetical protein [Actinoplanes lutulentus]MBB2947168.1 hypothetical protein [Actinoplanes lutulentus]RAK36443.1 hypothetical protein B0I29_10832 [Actinoplanes lutulentus]
MTPRPAEIPASMRQPLADAIVALADTPDDVPGVDDRLRRVAVLAADRIGAVDYAAVASRHGDGTCTVAAGGDLVQAVEDVSEDDETDGDTTMAWPGFRDTAAEMGLGMVSVPLFTGSGTAIASLDLYGREVSAMAPLTAGICAAYDPDLPWPGDTEDVAAMDAGGEELVTGFAEALSVRATIQCALALIMANDGIKDQDAYLKLRVRAAGDGVSLSAAANTVIMSKF